MKREETAISGYSEFLRVCDVTISLVSHTEAGYVERRGKLTRSVVDARKGSSFREVSKTMKKPEMLVSCEERKRILAHPVHNDGAPSGDDQGRVRGV